MNKHPTGNEVDEDEEQPEPYGRAEIVFTARVVLDEDEHCRSIRYPANAMRGQILKALAKDHFRVVESVAVTWDARKLDPIQPADPAQE